MKINSVNNAEYLVNVNKSSQFARKSLPVQDTVSFSGNKENVQKHKLSDKLANLFKKKVISEPIAQSKYFMFNGIINKDTKITDGFMDVGLGGEIYNNGEVHSYREIIVVNREEDKILNELIQRAKNDTVEMNERNKADYIYYMLINENAKHALINEKGIIPEINSKLLAGNTLGYMYGLGRHSSIIFKVIADEIGVKSDLIKGSLLGSKHAWNVVYFDGDAPKIYDCANRVVMYKNSTNAYKPMK